MREEHEIMQRKHRNLMVLPALFAVVALTACASPLSPPTGYAEVPHARINVIPDPNASVRDVKVFRSDRRILVMGSVQNETMRAFTGGSIQVQILDTSGVVKADSSGNIESSLVSSHGSALFRVFVEYAESFDVCRILVHPDIEGR